MPIRFMLDTDVLDDLTPRAELLATYADLVTDLAALQAKFPNSQIILIDRGLGDPTGQATIFDVEPGALTPEQAADGYDRQKAKGLRDLTVYCDRNTLPAVDQAMGDRVFYRWIATLDGTVAISGFTPLERPAAVQCFSAAMLGVHGDGSLVLDDDWHASVNVHNVAAVRMALSDAADKLTIAHDHIHRVAAAIGG